MSGMSARNPRTGLIDYRFEAPTADDLGAMAARARAAQPGWSELGFEGRAKILVQFAQELEHQRPALQLALEGDTGRRRIAALEIDSVLGAIAGWNATAPTLLPSDWTQGRSMPNLRHAPQWSPFALVGVISPWNFPLLLGLIDAIPALVAGCAVVVKPSEVTPRFIDPLKAAIAATPGLAEVFIVVAGDGATGQQVIDLADCVCFTGSVVTGKKVAVQAAGRLIPAFLELGGKDPLLVFAGADVEAATDAALRGSVLSTGQACQSI